MTFRVGQKVVCVIDASQWLDAAAEIACPDKGSVYTIRSISGSALDDGSYLRFYELRNPVTDSTLEGRGEASWLASAFRPIVEKTTDISIFTALLNPARRELVSSVIGEDINTL